jgi:glycogen phosphorylase
MSNVSTPVSAQHLLRALIVEDSSFDAELMVHELRRSGFEVNWARVESEAEYVAHIDEPLDIILADNSLPQFSGQRALQILQERELAIPFVVVSGTIGEEFAVAMIKQGAADYLLKENLARLGAVVVRAIQGQRKIAYFSMEIALASEIPTYGGGLGVLAGDTIRSAADLRVPMVAVSLLHRAGHFSQCLDLSGWQTEEPVHWSVEDFLIEMPARTTVKIEGRTVALRCWKYEVEGLAGYVVPVYLLDCDLPENTEADRRLTHFLYGGDSFYRLCQEVVLGIGGIRMLRTLGYDAIDRFHMNEGHASLLALELLRAEAASSGKSLIDINDLATVRQKCIFTTHTPVPAGHDQFPLTALSHVLELHDDLSDLFSPDVAARVFERRHAGDDGHPLLQGDARLNMTYLGLNMSRYVNGVAKKHGEVSRLMFAGYQIDAITNGVHAATWTCQPFQALYDQHIPDWRQDNFSLRHAESIPKQEVWDAHMRAKADLLAYVKFQTDLAMSNDILTLGFARRVTAYKRADLLFTDVERLKKIAESRGLQIIYAGKAHPGDQDGKFLIQRIFRLKAALKDNIKIAFLPNYDLDIAKLITSGVDLWLNTPQPPLEASGTSGMKAALNGIPSLSVLDGWWVEGLIEGVTGWAIGDQAYADSERSGGRDASSLYEKLEGEVMSSFYDNRESYIEIMRHAIALNGSFFHTQRMLQQYVLKAYFR